MCVSGSGSGHQSAADGSEVFSVFLRAAAGSEGSGSCADACAPPVIADGAPSPTQHAESAQDAERPDAASEVAEPRSEPEPRRVPAGCAGPDGAADGTELVRAAEPASPFPTAEPTGSQRRSGPVQRE